jgi:hypothetical protein
MGAGAMNTPDIDWLSVEMICQGESLKLKYADEKRAVVRRLNEKLLDHSESAVYVPPGKISATEVARRMHTTERSVIRYRNELPPAVKQRCPDCGEPMWVLADGTVEPHSTALYQTCGSEEPIDFSAVAS